MHTTHETPYKNLKSQQTPWMYCYDLESIYFLDKVIIKEKGEITPT